MDERIKYVEIFSIFYQYLILSDFLKKLPIQQVKLYLIIVLFAFSGLLVKLKMLLYI